MQQHHDATRRCSDLRQPVRAAAALTGAVLLLAVAACSNDEGGRPAASPSASTSSSGTPGTSSATSSEREQGAVAAADAFDRTVDAMAAGDPVNLEKLERYATTSVALDQAKDLAQLKSSDLETRGESKTSLIAVRVQGTTATVKRCIDASKVVIYKHGASKPFGRSHGLPAATSSVQLVRQGDAWLLSKRDETDGQPCSVRS